MKDRHNEDEARTIIKKIVPDASVRKILFPIIVDAIFEANHIGSNQWAITYRDNFVRLVVGHYIVVTIFEDGLWVALDKFLYSSFQRLNSEDFNSFEKLWAPDKPENKGSYPYYKNVNHDPFSINGEFRLNKASNEELLILRQLLIEFIHNVIENGYSISQRTKYAHCSGIIKYLSHELKREIPQPDYFQSL